ncbi:hypothetical protein OC844_001420 [Tilletia horrida]|nr:hypothetical protein OC844_001420 [Tilletia horrida]
MSDVDARSTAEREVAKDPLQARQGLLIPSVDGPPPPENAGQILSSLQIQNAPTPTLLPTDLFAQLLSDAMPDPTSKIPSAVTSALHPTMSHHVNPAAHSSARSSKSGSDDGEGPAPFKIVYLTPLFVLVGLFLIFSIGGKVWGSAWRSKQRELRRRRKHHQNLEKDTEHQALDPDSSADGPHGRGQLSDDEDDVLPRSRRLRERRSEQNLVHDNGSTGLLHAFGVRILGTKGQMIPPTTRDRAGNKYSIPVQSNAWWKVHMNRAMSKPNLNEEDEDDLSPNEVMSQEHQRPFISISRRATVVSGTSSLLRTPPDRSRSVSPSKMTRPLYEPDSPTRPAKPGTSYFPYVEDDLQSVIVHSPPASPTKEDEPSRWHCRSVISSTTRGTSLSRSDTLTSSRSSQQQSPSRKPTQRRNAGRRQDSVIEIEPIPEPAPARLPAELRIGVNPNMAPPLDKSSVPSSPTKRNLDQALFIAAPTTASYGLQPALDVKTYSGGGSSASSTASRTNSERSSRSAGTATSAGQTSVTTTTSSSSRSSSPQRRAAMARRSPNKLRSGAAPLSRENSVKAARLASENNDEDYDETILTRAFTSPPLRGRGGGQRDGDAGAGSDIFTSLENSPRRARTADSPSKKVRTPAEKTRERILALQSAQTLIEQSMINRSAGGDTGR